MSSNTLRKDSSDHDTYPSRVFDTPRILQRQDIGVPDDTTLAELVARHGIDTMLGAAGSATFFECNVMHGSNSNITPLARSNVFVIYNSVSNTPGEPFCGLAPRPPFIAEREDFRPVGRD